MSTALVPLGELCDVLDSRRKPVTKRDRVAGEFPYYGATGILDYVVEYIFDEKLVLIGEDGAKWGAGEKTAFAAEGKYWVNNHAHVIRPNRNRVLDKWIIYHLNFSDLSKFITGLTVPKLNQGKLCEIPIPLPPLPEQQRIVAILDEAFAGLAIATANAEKNLRNARELFESYLNSVVANRRVRWVDKKLSEICEVKDGTHDSPEYVESGVSFVTQKNITSDGLSLSDVKFISETDHQNFYRRSNAAFGDILISMIGANRGMACAIDDRTIFSIKNVGLIKSGPNINHEYLLYFLKSAVAQDYVRVASRGGAQEFVGLAKLRDFPIVVPPRQDQLAFVVTLNELLEKTSQLRVAYRRKLYYLDALKQSILQKAFSGELTSPPSQAIKEAAE